MNWKCAGTAVQGRRHLKEKKPCQDKICLYSNENFVCISLGDGAGSYKHSGIGAEISTYRLCKYLDRHFDFIWESDADISKKNIIHSIRTSIGIVAKAKKSILDEFSSTLLFAGVKNDRFICGHLGDGILGILRNDELTVLSPPDTGEFANETYFITSSDYQNKFRLFKGNIDDIDGFVIMSDGTSNSLFDRKNYLLAPILKDIFNWLVSYPINEVEKALKINFENVIKMKTTDDCSIALLRKNE